MTSAISQKAMVVSLSISRLGTSRKDKAVTSKVLDEYSTDQNAGNFNKKLFPKEVLKPIGEIASKIRSFHNSITLPWTDDGTRLLASKSFEKYNLSMLDYVDAFNKCVDEFIANYDENIAMAQELLGDMFNPEDYDAKDSVKGKFSVKFSYFPVPTAKDFRVDLAADDLKKVQDEIEHDINARHKHAITTAWFSVRDLIARLIDRLEDGDKILKSRVVDSIKEMIPVLEAFNFDDDQKFNDIIDSIRNSVCPYTVKELNIDTAKCNDVIANAKKVVAQIGDYAAFFKKED